MIDNPTPETIPNKSIQIAHYAIVVLGGNSNVFIVLCIINHRRDYSTYQLEKNKINAG